MLDVENSPQAATHMEVSDFKLPELSAKNVTYQSSEEAKSGVGHAPSNRKTKKKKSLIPVTDYTSQYWKSDNQAPEEVFDKVQITREIAQHYALPKNPEPLSPRYPMLLKT